MTRRTVELTVEVRRHPGKLQGMRTILVILAVTALGCAKKPTAKTVDTVPPSLDRHATTTEAPPAPKPTTAVSPSLSLSSDLAAQCGIQANDQVPPSFAYNDAELLEEDRAVLQQVATCLMTGPLKGRGVELIGRADPRGTQEYNLGLGAKRAHSVSEYLRRLGVGEQQLAENTRGDLEASGTDEASWQKDRRVDIQLRD